MMKKKIFALVLALVMVLALVPAMAQAGSEQEDVTISKTAMAVEGMVNAWDIELTVNAAAKVNPAPGNDVILVLDNSNSMYEGSRMANAKRAAKAFPPPHKRQQADSQPREQPDIRVFDEENPARRRAEAQHAPARLFLRPRHRRQRQINANGQRRQRKFLRASALRERRAAANDRRQNRHAQQRQPPLAEERNRPPARVNRRREAQRLQNEHADEARIRNRRPQRVEHEQQRPLVVKQIAIWHQPARHAAPDGEIDVRIRPKIGGVQRRAARRNQQRQRRAEQRQQRGERPFHSLFLLYRYSVLFSRLSSS